MKTKQFLSGLLTLLISINLAAQAEGLLLPEEQSREKVFHYDAHSFSYNYSYMQPSWVVYWVKSSQYETNEHISPKFVTDPNVGSRTADLKDYKKSGYVIGQYMSSNDVAKNEKALQESMYLTNGTAMKQAFYKYIWFKLEQTTRAWAKEGDLMVITGGILKDAPFPTIGKNKVSVINRFYKIIYNPETVEAVAFVFKNGSSSGSLKGYAKSVAKLEELSGIKFFASLPEAEQAKIKSKVNLDAWNWEILEE